MGRASLGLAAGSVTAELRKAIGKAEGDAVIVHLEEIDH
jgi:hypothetical protein